MTASDSQTGAEAGDTKNLAEGVDREIVVSNQRVYQGYGNHLIVAMCIGYTAFHIGVMNLYPLETWVYRLSHVTGGLMLGYLLFSAGVFRGEDAAARPRRLVLPPVLEYLMAGLAGALVLLALGQIILAVMSNDLVATGSPRDKMLATFGWPLTAGTALAIATAWLFPGKQSSRLSPADFVLTAAALTVGLYIINHAEFLRLRAGMPGLVHPNDMYAAIAGIALILELTRRLAGMALVIIVLVFIAYGFVGPWLPGFLNHRGYNPDRYFARIYTDVGILGPTTAVSSTYIILFITFAAFLQASRVGEYFINFAFAAAGNARGGPAKVAVFGSALMGTINGTSAGNVVSTGSLTIPLMKKVGYRPQTAASVEAAASSGGQILPPIMGAGAFIMAEITGIQYREIVIAAIIPAALYFVSVYFMVDKEALKKGMRGLPRSELPRFGAMAKQAYLFIPIIMLIAALYVGYSVIRAGTYAMIAAFAVSYIRVFVDGQRTEGWFNHLVALLLMVLAVTPIVVGISLALHGAQPVQLAIGETVLFAYEAGAPVQFGAALVAAALAIGGLVSLARRDPRGQVAVAKTVEHFRMIPYAFEIAAKMSLQLVAVCAAAGVIVGVIAITGVGTRLSSVLMTIAGQSQLLALFFAMCVAIILGMGMPTTAAYAVAASVIAPGLIRMGIEPLTAHFFIFYYAVMSAITPPVALAAYAGAAIAQSDPMRTSVESFKIGLAAFVVPFMFFYSSTLLMQGEWWDPQLFEITTIAFLGATEESPLNLYLPYSPILHTFVTACIGIYLLASAVQGWMFGMLNPVLRVLVGAAALAMIAGGWMSDIIGLATAGAIFLIQKRLISPHNIARGAD